MPQAASYSLRLDVRSARFWMRRGAFQIAILG
jgi:hypothetical protein